MVAGARHSIAPGERDKRKDFDPGDRKQVQHCALEEPYAINSYVECPQVE